MLKLKYIALFFITFVFACTNQQEKVIVEGGTPSVKVQSESDAVSSTDESMGITVEDDLSQDELKSTIYTKKLIEVGDRVFFDYDKTRFKKEGIETLKRQARFLLDNRAITVTIEGHCDARGTREYNLALGERRAYSVKSFLSSLGVEEDRISVISYGKEKMQATGDNERAWAQSRTAITIINP